MSKRKGIDRYPRGTVWIHEQRGNSKPVKMERIQMETGGVVAFAKGSIDTTFYPFDMIHRIEYRSMNKKELMAVAKIRVEEDQADIAREMEAMKDQDTQEDERE